MQPDKTRTADAREWLVKTLQDLRRVEILLAAIPADVEGAGRDSQRIRHTLSLPPVPVMSRAWRRPELRWHWRAN